MMDLEQAIKTLEDLRRNDPVVQRGRNAELTQSFKVFWDSRPDEATYSKHTGGLLITPTLLYYMVEHPIWMRRPDDPPEPASAPEPAPAPTIPATEPQVQKKEQPKKDGGKHSHR